MRILIALDGTPHSQRALGWVSSLRWPAGSRVIVATVVRSAAAPLPSSPEVLDPGEAGAGEQAMVSSARDRLRACGLSTEARVVSGDPGAQLLRLADQERVDLLVVGSRGRKGIVRTILGSVSGHAVGHAMCSVLVVKQGEVS